MKTIRWGIVGCGDVTEVKSGPGLQKARHSALVAVMRRNGELAKDYAQRHGVPTWYDDAETLINDPQVDAVYVATPPSSHKAYTIMAAQAGKPVYVEKPMALNYAECVAMIEACEKTASSEGAIPLFVAYYRRGLDRFLKIKELLDSGAIGEMRFVTITLYQPVHSEELNKDTLPWRVLPEVAGGGYFVDLASHQLDFLDYVLGPIRSVHGFAANQAGHYPAEDIVSGSFVFESGVQGMGTWCFSTFDALDRTEIVGSKGRIAYTTFDDTPITLTTASGTEEFAIGYPEHIQQPLIQSVVDALNGLRTCHSTGNSAARTSWVMDQMLAGYKF
ncbi:MAG: Gfo/Idh/MocA family oxidoreductase [Ardenticatenaceae bacterium]|nr:Gfo/Idh/MocA family oxidoreductase [Ardenticatenaceae bacterium]MCB9445193.1 Gfo/Idh/MocA family oxidoreductase [Ardenticatenaceae bacterium]